MNILWPTTYIFLSYMVTDAVTTGWVSFQQQYTCPNVTFHPMKRGKSNICIINHAFIKSVNLVPIKPCAMDDFAFHINWKVNFLNVPIINLVKYDLIPCMHVWKCSWHHHFRPPGHKMLTPCLKYLVCTNPLPWNTVWTCFNACIWMGNKLATWVWNYAFY